MQRTDSCRGWKTIRFIEGERQRDYPLGFWIPLALLLGLVVTAWDVHQPTPQSGMRAESPAGLLASPYLGHTTPSSVVISWATEDAGDSEVRYGLDLSYNNIVSASTHILDDKYWHSATITGLLTGTTYYYKAFTADTDVTPWDEVTFTTTPEPAALSFTFAALGDSRPDEIDSPPDQAAFDVANQMVQHRFDLGIHVGDMVRGGSVCSGDDSSWNQYIRAYFGVYQEIIGHIPFYPSLGNHEQPTAGCGLEAYAGIFSLPANAPPGDEEEYYSFDWGNAHFVVLDTNQDFAPGSAQYDWLIEDLEASTQLWTFVSFHEPAYSSGYHGSSSAVQNRLVPLFEAYGVDIVLNGHDHNYERTCPILNGACSAVEDGGVVYFVTGGGGAGLRDVGEEWFTEQAVKIYHFLLVQVDGCRLHVDAIDKEGDLFDAYDMEKCAEATPTPTATPIPPPANLAAEWEEASATLQWDPIADPTTDYQYRVYYDSDTSGPPYDGRGLPQGDSPIEIGTEPQYSLDGLEAGTVYYIAVTARDPQGGESDYSNEVSNTPTLSYPVYLPLALNAD